MNESLKQQCLSVLSQADIFSAVSTSELERLLETEARVQRFRKEEVLYSPDSAEKCIGIILHGEARVMKEHVTMSLLRKGMHFGTVVLYNDAERFVNTIVAKTDCNVLFLQKSGVDNLMAHNRHFAMAYVAYLSKRIYFLNAKIEAYTAPNAEEKLLHYLLSICDENGAVSGISMTELSRQINVSRAGIYRALDSLSANGKLRHSGKNITLFAKDEQL